MKGLQQRVNYLEGTTRVQNMHILAPNDPFKKLDEDYQRLKREYEKLAKDKKKLMEDLHQEKQATMMVRGQSFSFLRLQQQYMIIMMMADSTNTTTTTTTTLCAERSCAGGTDAGKNQECDEGGHGFVRFHPPHDLQSSLDGFQ